MVNLPFSGLSSSACNAHVLPKLATHSLISIPKLADAGYTFIFHLGNRGMTVHEENSCALQISKPAVLQGWRDNNGLWSVGYQGRENDNTKNSDLAAIVYSLPFIPQVIKYLHAAASFPTKAAWIEAIKAGHYTSWPGLTVERVQKHFPSE